MGESFVAFQEQLNLYLQEFSSTNLDFRRMSLVYAFQDYSNSISTSLDIDDHHLAALKTFLALDTSDPVLFSECGLDFLESIIRLQIITSPTVIDTIQEIALKIATNSNAKDLQNELNIVMSYLTSDEDSHPLEILRSEKIKKGEEMHDICKTVITFYIPHLIKRFEPKDLSLCFKNFSTYLSLLESDIANYNAVLGSELMDGIIYEISCRKVQLKRRAFHQTLGFILGLISIYEKSKVFPTHKEMLIDLIQEIYIHFMAVFDHFVRIKPETKNFAEGLAIIAEAASTSRGLKFPLVFSTLRRLQIFVPIACLSASTLPNVFFNLMNHSVKFYTQKFTNSDCIVKLMPKQVDISKIIKAFMDISG